ncbi:extensin [Ceratitis capitata]|uniref:DAZ-associated protein 2 n=1 Tax=Ceratitis capitata TaxID=7213 RepID=W8CE29_CERCA|nr:extensin [Ceratitis capitata]CAD7000358.1 unnamed protein product [Ceratitis capitata]
MSNNKEIASSSLPTAPESINEVASGGYNYRPPPPSYEESQRMYTSSAANVAPKQMSSNSYMPSYATNNSPHQIPTTNYIQNYAASPPPPPQYYQHHYVSATCPPTFSVPNEPHVLSLAPGAKIRTTSAGAVSIPPPPPGCAPTAAQYALMQGQPVLVKKTKRSFF